MDNKENTDTKTRRYNNFDISVWKVKDKVWMQERRAGWALVKKTLDYIHEDLLDAIRYKKDYKYIKQFYLTGSIDFPKEIGDISYIGVILEMNSPLDQVVDCSLLLECWLTPKPSKKKWEQIVDRYESSLAVRNLSEKPFKINKKIYQQALIQWFTKSDQVSLFNGLEPELTGFFQPFPDSSDYNFYWRESFLYRYLLSCGWQRGHNNDGNPVYNPFHPVYKYSEQFIETFLPYYHNLKQSIID